MSVPEFRGIFTREIDRFVGQLQRGYARGSSLGGSNAPRAEPAPPRKVLDEFELQQLDAFKKLAIQMMERILARLVHHASEIGLDVEASCTPGELLDDAVRQASNEQAASAHEQTRARRRQLEERLKQRREEEDRIRKEIVEMQRVHNSEVLPACDAELLGARQLAAAAAAAATMSPASSTAYGMPGDLAELLRAFDEEYRHLRGNLATANEKIAFIDRKERDLEQLQKPQMVPNVLTLAGLEDTMELDAESRQLQEMLLHGEQALKRMKRHIEEP